MKNNALIKLVIAALFAALVCVSTMVIQFPSPLEGYLNAGDCFVLVSAWILGYGYGAAAAGIGSMLADILTSYAHYAPATFVIKACMALAAVLVYNIVTGKLKLKPIFGYILSGLCAEIIMVFGYFSYSALFRGKGLAAAIGIPGNLIQGAAGIILAVIVITIIKKSKLLDAIDNSNKLC